jgi:two-component system, NtrC family, sensor kinase
MSAVFSNLLRNSRDAIDSKGVIHVRSFVRAGTSVIEVEDDGRGIASERLATIFEPSFTVRGSRIATGNWGLFNSRSIIRALGGEIEIRSVEGKATTVTIALPNDGV